MNNISGLFVPISLFREHSSSRKIGVLCFFLFRFNINSLIQNPFQELVKLFGISRSHLFSILNELEKEGFLKREEIAGEVYFSRGKKSDILVRELGWDRSGKGDLARARDSSRKRESLKSPKEKRNKKEKINKKEIKFPILKKFPEDLREKILILLDGPWKKKSDESIMENLLYLSNFDHLEALEVVNTTIRGEYRGFIMGKTKTKEEKQFRTQTGISTGPTREASTDLMFFLINQEKNASEFRKKVRAAWGGLAENFEVGARGKELIFDEKVCFHFDETRKTLSISYPRDLSHFIEKEVIKRAYQNLEEISDIECVEL